MTPPPVIDAIRARVNDWTPSDAEICARLNAPTEPNPEPQQMVRRHLSASDLLHLLSPKSAAKVAQWPNLAMVRADIDGQDHSAAADMIQLAAAAGIITPDEAGKCMMYINEEIPDPHYCPLISWAQTTIGRPVTVNDVAAARPEGDA